MTASLYQRGSASKAEAGRPRSRREEGLKRRRPRRGGGAVGAGREGRSWLRIGLWLHGRRGPARVSVARTAFAGACVLLWWMEEILDDRRPDPAPGRRGRH